MGIKQLAPDTLSMVHRGVLTPDGTTLQVAGYKGCVLYGGGETGSGSNYHAYYAHFFTTQDLPTVVAY